MDLVDHLVVNKNTTTTTTTTDMPESGTETSRAILDTQNIKISG